MSGKVSSSKGKGGAKKSGQKYQNKFAFAPNKYSAVAQKRAAMPVQGVCQRCMDIIQWKKRMNKYKPLTQPKTCTGCLRRTVVDAYHVICKDCAATNNCCAKCQESHELVEFNAQKPAAVVLKEQQDLQRIVESMTERMRRSYHRKLDRGDQEAADAILARAEASAAQK
eukprot:jgi/Hompol1/6426/HPOL_002155-RA